MPQEEIPLSQQRCGLCYYWRPTESPRGQCRHELPKREIVRGTAVAVFVPIDSTGWCAKWKLYPEERPVVEAINPEPPSTAEPSLPGAPAPVPAQPGTNAVPKTGTWQGTITRGGKPSPQKWKRDEGPDTSKAPPELKGE